MNANALQWDGTPGHYEVHYLTLTDPATRWGIWIRYTMRAPLDGSAGEAHLWFLAMHPDGRRFARKETLPVDRLVAEAEPFRLSIGDSELSDRGCAGAVDGARWELAWEPRLEAAEHVHPLLRRLKIARTVLVLPHPDVAVSGTIAFDGEELTLDGVHGGQAHLWGSKHAARWAWAHCGDFATHAGEPVRDAYVDGVSVVVPRFGREVGPSTPVVGRFLGEDFRATSPAAVLRAPSRFGLSSWHFEAVDGARKIVVEVDAPRETLAGVTYHDPDGDLAYCYNSEVASMRLGVLDKRGRGRFGWVLRETYVADGTAHFEYAQRTPVADVDLLV